MWGRWWWGHLSGYLIVAPPIITCATHSRAPHTKKPPKPVEAVALTLTVLIVVLIVLGRWLPEWLPASNAPYYLLPMLLWAGVRFGPRGAGLASLGASATAIFAQSFGLGPFYRLSDLHSFIAISTISTLMISALAIERLRAVERKGAIELGALDGIVTINSRRQIVELNPAAERMFGVRDSEAKGKDITMLIAPRHRSLFEREFERYVRTGTGLVGSRYRATAWRPRGGLEFPVDIAIVRVPVEGELLVTGFVRDVSKEQQAARALRAAHDDLERKVEERTSELLAANRELEWRELLMRQAEELAHLGSFDLDLRNNELHWSDELYRIYGRDLRELKPSYTDFLSAVHPDDRDALRSRMEQATADVSPFELEARIMRPDGTVRVLQTTARTFVDDAGHPVRIAGCCQDITERKQSDAVRSKLAQLVESSDDAMIVLSTTGTIDTWNHAAAKMFGYSREEVQGQPSAILLTDSPTHRIEDVLSMIRRGKRVPPYERRYKRKDGSVFEASVTASAVTDHAGHIIGISKVLRDITPQKLVEMKMRASLQEKEVLLREIHHRVKNNLQVIASLLNIQVTAEPDAEARKGLAESQNRIHSMALVHQLLYQSKDLAQIDAGEYLEKLVNRLVQGYNIAPDRISVHVSVASLRLDIDRAIPCGLIVNELVTNALTHAFPDSRKGHVLVLLTQENDTVTLTVSDDGVGIPKDVDLEHVRSFGLRIASTLAKQLEGTITLTRKNGTTFSIVFPNVSRHLNQAA
jgi:PAS domain S-box-containing protein